MAPKKFELTEVDREILRSYQYMLDGLALYLGDSYEIVLHSLDELSHSVIKIINGHYTKREVARRSPTWHSPCCTIFRKARPRTPWSTSTGERGTLLNL